MANYTNALNPNPSRQKFMTSKVEVDPIPLEKVNFVDGIPILKWAKYNWKIAICYSWKNFVWIA